MKADAAILDIIVTSFLVSKRNGPNIPVNNLMKIDHIMKQK